MRWYRKLHWQILVGLSSGLVYGVLAAANGWGLFTEHWVAPFGTIFINSLQLIAVPLVLASIVTGVASLGRPTSAKRPIASESSDRKSPLSFTA